MRTYLMLAVAMMLFATSAAAAPAIAAPAAFDDVSGVPSGDLFPSSYWTTPLPGDVPAHPLSDEIIDFIVADNDLNGCITLAGGEGNKWGLPIFTADAATPIYNVQSRKWDIPPEFSSLRIPKGSTAADNSDGQMVVYDPIAGYVVELSKAEYDAATDSWTVSGGSVAYLDSNGLYGQVVGSDETRNGGSFRGYSGAVAAVHYDEVAAGEIQRVHMISVNTANVGHIFPFTGSDGDLSTPEAPLQGARIRIKQGVNLEALGLSSQALVIARGLQEYGMVVSDSSGGGVVLTLEDTGRSGRGDLWDLDRESLCAITGDHLEVVTTGFEDIFETTFEADALTLLDQDVTHGCGGWDYCPDEPITRGQMAAFLTRAMDLPAPGPGNRFVDDDNSIFEADIESLAEAKITLGCNPPVNDRFCPTATVTRGQMAAFLVRARGYTDDGGGGLFTDDDNSIFESDIDKLGTAGVTKGCNPPVNDVFCPGGRVTRGQMAAFISRAFFSG